jgi:hypothetical protein
MSESESDVNALHVAAHGVREAARPACGACFGKTHHIVALPDADRSRAVPPSLCSSVSVRSQ